jgi:hypothetical protein
LIAGQSGGWCPYLVSFVIFHCSFLVSLFLSLVYSQSHGSLSYLLALFVRFLWYLPFLHYVHEPACQHSRLYIHHLCANLAPASPHLLFVFLAVLMSCRSVTSLSAVDFQPHTESFSKTWLLECLSRPPRLIGCISIIRRPGSQD